MAEAPRDQNFVPAALFEIDGTPGSVMAGKIDETTGRILVDVPGGTGSVTSVSVVSANGFSGTVATATSTPAITLTTTITGILKGNGTAISAITIGSGLSFDGTTLSATGGSGTVTSVAMSVPTGLTVTGSPVTTTGTLAVALNTGYVIPLQSTLDAFAPKTSPTFAVSITGNYLTASEILITDASKNIVSAPVATYPSLVELAYVKGVSSAIQTQINAKQATITFGTGVQSALGVNIGAAGAPVLFNGALGTPSSGIVTNLTGTASININGTVGATTPTTGAFTTISASSTVTASATIELGHATDTTLSRSAAGVIAVEGVVIPSISSTNTLTNKRVTPRTGTTTSSATPTINTDNVDFYSLTAQAVDITSFTTNLSGTPTEGQKLWIAITGTAARSITWGASFENGPVALPTTTVTTTRLDVGFIWNSVTSKWRCVASGSTV